MLSYPTYSLWRKDHHGPQRVFNCKARDYCTTLPSTSSWGTLTAQCSSGTVICGDLGSASYRPFHSWRHNHYFNLYRLFLCMDHILCSKVFACLPMHQIIVCFTCAPKYLSVLPVLQSIWPFCLCTKLLAVLRVLQSWLYDTIYSLKLHKIWISIVVLQYSFIVTS